MCGITDLDDACTGGCPAGLRVAPQELKVDDGVWWCAVDEILEDGCPFNLFHTRHVFHTLEDFFLVNGVAPALFLSAGDLGKLAMYQKVSFRAHLHRGS